MYKYFLENVTITRFVIVYDTKRLPVNVIYRPKSLCRTESRDKVCIPILGRYARVYDVGTTHSHGRMNAPE